MSSLLQHSPTVRLDLSKCLAQTRAYRALQPGNTICLPWGRGIGKSWWIRRHWYTRIAQYDGRERETGLGGVQRGVRIVLLMPTLKQAKKVHAEPMLSELRRDGEWGCLGGWVNRGDWRVTFPGGSWIQWVSAENAQDNRGLRCDVVDVDEADDVPREVYSAVVAPWFSEPWSLRETVIAGTPRRGRYGLLWRAHHTWPNGDDTGPPVPGHFSFHATYRDAPLIVDRKLVELERLRLRATPEIFEREWECNFDSGEGVVYPFFDREFHVREPDYGVPWTEILVGVDHGFEHPGAILAAGVLGKGDDAIVHVLEETYARRKDPIWWASRAADMAGRYLNSRQRWYYDPSQPGMGEAIKKSIRTAWGDRANFSIEAADNAVEPGIEAVATRLAPVESEERGRTARCYVSPACRSTIEEFGLYRRKRDPRNKDRILDDVDKRNDDAMDALRYLIVGRFGRPASPRYTYQAPDVVPPTRY